MSCAYVYLFCFIQSHEAREKHIHVDQQTASHHSGAQQRGQGLGVGWAHGFWGRSLPAKSRDRAPRRSGGDVHIHMCTDTVRRQYRIYTVSQKLCQCYF